jgi:hypothetical protein
VAGVGPCLIQRPLLSWPRKVRMPVAPCSVHLMPDSLSRWPDLQSASATPEPTNRPRARYWAWRMRLVGSEVVQGLIAVAGLAGGERQGASRGEDGGDVAVVEFGEPFGKPPG